MANETWLLGPNAVLSALASDPVNLLEILIDGERRDKRVRDIERAAAEAGVHCEHVARDQLRKRFDRQRHQGVAARYRAPTPLAMEEFLERIADDGQALVLVLDHIEDRSIQRENFRTGHRGWGTVWGSVNSKSPSSPPSRPNPDCFIPPKGASGVGPVPVLNPTWPNRSRSMIQFPRSGSAPKT